MLRSSALFVDTAAAAAVCAAAPAARWNRRRRRGIRLIRGNYWAHG